MFTMWRLFRLGIKSNSCNGNQAHFRIIGTSCTNNEDLKELDDPNTFGTIGNKENYEVNCFRKSTLAGQAAKEHLKNFDLPISDSLNKPLLTSLKGIDDSTVNKKVTNLTNKKPLKNNSQGNEIDSIGSLKNETCKNWQHRKHLPPKKSIEKFQPTICGTQKGIEIDGPSSNEINDTVFGSLSQVSKFEIIPDDKEDLPHPLAGTFGKRLTDDQYGRKMLKLCKERKLKEAIDVLEIEMADQNVRPNTYCFNVLINACGKAGYVKKACSLFYKMKQIGLTPEKFAYTGVFNACGNVSSDVKEFGLNEATNLRRQIKEKGIIISPITYHAMIKAFGRCGDLKTAFEIVDDMLLEKHRITTETLNFLLQGCISDKEAGFRHALMVWRKLKMLRLARSIYSYNLLLRCVKECQAGDPALFSQLLDPLPSKNKGNKEGHLSLSPCKSEYAEVKQFNQSNSDAFQEHNSGTELKTSKPLINSDPTNGKDDLCQILSNNDAIKVQLEENMELEVINNDVPRNLIEPDFPDLLDFSFSSRGHIVAIASLKKPQDRLALLGGPAGVVKNMIKDNVQPNIATFTFFLESIPPTLDAEKSLLLSMASFDVKPDITFYNMLIKKRARRNCIEDAKDVLDLMREENIQPDIITYGCLAIAATKPTDGINLLNDMKKIGIRPNIEIFGSLIFSSIRRREFMYTVQLLHRMAHYDIEANDIILKYLEEARNLARKTLLEKEQMDETLKMEQKTSRKHEEMKLFLLEYKHWLKKSQYQIPDQPWAQYGYKHKMNYAIAKIK